MGNDTEYIDDYFNRMLTNEEVRQFERRLIDDRSFAEEVAFYLSARSVLKDQVIREKKEWFRKLLEQNSSVIDIHGHEHVKKVWIYRIAAAAVILICISVAWYLIFSKSSPAQMADSYINQHLKTLSVTMGTEKDSIQNGLRLFNAGQYDSARRQFETIIQKDTGNYSAKRYLGIVYLELGNYDKSLQYFHQLENYSLFSNPAIFYQALTLMKRNQPGDKQKARQLLQQVVDQGLEGKEPAQRWLRKW